MKKTTKQTPANDRIEIIYLLDRSGSMGSIRAGAIDGFNTFLSDQIDGEGDARLSLILFDDVIEKHINGVSIEKVRRLKSKDYRPRGCTALLDAVGGTIKRTRKAIKAMPKKKRPAAVIIAIFTDGYENSSKKYTMDKVSSMIRKRQDKDGWKFLFLAANQDAIATALQFNIPRENASNVAFDNEGINSSYRATSRKTKALRAMMLNREIDAETKNDLESSLSDLVDDES